jgi:glycerophosphoryl diester phosphodiesterase
VHLYTLRNEPNYYNATFNSIDAEYSYYFKTLGVEGGFTDFPGTLVPWTKAKGPWPPGNGNRWLQ